MARPQQTKTIGELTSEEYEAYASVTWRMYGRHHKTHLREPPMIMDGGEHHPSCFCFECFFTDHMDLVLEQEERGLVSDLKGFVYVLQNPAFPRYLKIGFSSHGNLESRIKNLGRDTGVPFDFDLLMAFECQQPSRVEAKAHHILKEYRISPRKEFFDLNLDKARSAIQKADKEVNGNEMV